MPLERGKMSKTMPRSASLQNIAQPGLVNYSPISYRAKNINAPEGPLVNPSDPVNHLYMYWENMRMQSMIYQKEMSISLAQKELKRKMKQEKRLQEIMQLCDLKEDKVYDRAQKTAALVGDEPKGEKKVYKNDNPEADGVLLDLHNQEYKMAKILSTLDENSNSYRTKLQKLRDMVKVRKELERMLHFKVDQNHYNYEKVKQERKQKDYYAERLRKRIHMEGAPVKSIRDYSKQEMDPYRDGFFIQFDYILDIVKEFPQVQLVYGIYRRSVQINEPKQVDLVFTEDSHDPTFSMALFDQRHTLRKLKAHSDTMLIIELQVPERDNVYAENKMNTANKNFGEINNMKTYAWTCIDLFTSKRGLKEGAFKIPFYRPPTSLNVSKESIGKYIRITPTLLYMRIMRLEPTHISEIFCNPAYKKKYVIHDFHDFVKRGLAPAKDQENAGINVTIHYVKGVIPETHVRVACCLQVGEDILRAQNQNLCFFATKGLKAGGKTAHEVSKAVTVGNMNPPKTERGDEQEETEGYAKTAQTSTALLEFNETKSWIRDIEASYRDESGRVVTDCYLIIQLLQKNTKSYPRKVTNRQMLEDDYELIGYTVLQMNLKDGSLAYGTYHLQFFEGPIFVEELDPSKKMSTSVKITISPITFSLPYGEQNQRHPSKTLKPHRKDYDSYVVNHEPSSTHLPPQAVKTPETVNTTHRINNRGQPSNPAFAEFAKALSPDDKF